MNIPIREYWRLLSRYLVAQRGAALSMAVLLLADIGLQIIGPQVIGYYIDAVQTGASVSVLVRAALVFIVASIVQQVMHVLSGYWSERVAWTATNALRLDLATHLLGLDPGFYEARTPGELIERVDGDVSQLASFFSSLVVQFGGSVLFLIGVLAAITLADLKIGLVLIAFTLLDLPFGIWMGGFSIRAWTRAREYGARYLGFVGEVLAATEDIRSNGAVSYAMRRLFEHMRIQARIRLRANVWGSTAWGSGILIYGLIKALTYGTGGSLYQASALSLGTVYAIVAYVERLTIALNGIPLPGLQMASASIRRVYELMQVRSSLRDGPAAPPTGALPVEFDHVSFAYEPAGDLSPQASSDLVLCNLSFRLSPGRTLGLLGRTGSGKTTIARLLFRFYDPQGGEVRLGGLSLQEARVEALRARVGLVTQDVQLFQGSLRDNITFYDPDVPDDRLVALLDGLGLGEWVSHLPHGLDTMISNDSLSAGEAQLVALARVHLKDPGLIVLDEASSRLDPATGILLERALDRLLVGRTAVIIAHRLSTVERADEILILDKGGVLEHGSREQLAADPDSRYAALLKTGLSEVLV
jgi:ATP-binding cassette subfamily B protein